MIATVAIGAELVVRELPVKTFERLRQTLTVPNPVFRQKQRHGFGAGPGRHGDTGGEPRRLECVVRLPTGDVHIPAGATHVVEEAAHADGVELVWTDGRADGAPLDATWTLPPVALHDYQQTAVDMALAKERGVIVLPPGTGKTRIGSVVVGRVRRTALVLVPTIDIAQQWLAVFAAMGLTAGLVGDGKDERYFPVVVSIDDAVDALLARDPSWGTRFGVVLADECHHVGSRTYERILRHLPARYRIGLTATPERQDGLTDLVYWRIGPELFRRSVAEMIRLGYLQAATVRQVPTSFTFPPFADPRRPTNAELTALEADLAEDLARLSLIASRVAERAKAGVPSLVLCSRKSQTVDVATMLEAQGVQAAALTSKAGKKKRAAAIEGLRAGTILVVCATSLADEGLDVPRLGYIALAGSLSARGATIQRLGRLLRRWEGKKPHLDDFVDVHVPTLVRRAAARRKVFQEAGCWNPHEGEGTLFR
jgi:superfamily II DNA or RNA helicase